MKKLEEFIIENFKINSNIILKNKKNIDIQIKDISEIEFPAGDFNKILKFTENLKYSPDRIRYLFNSNSLVLDYLNNDKVSNRITFEYINTNSTKGYQIHFINNQNSKTYPDFLKTFDLEDAFKCINENFDNYIVIESFKINSKNISKNFNILTLNQLKENLIDLFGLSEKEVNNMVDDIDNIDKNNDFEFFNNTNKKLDNICTELLKNPLKRYPNLSLLYIKPSKKIYMFSYQSEEATLTLFKKNKIISDRYLIFIDDLNKKNYIYRIV